MDFQYYKRGNRFIQASDLKRYNERYDSIRQLLYALAIALFISFILSILDYNKML
jgi:hypothetical protein